MKVGDRVYVSKSNRFGVIRHVPFIFAELLWDYGVLIDGERVDSLWGYNADELLPVEVTVVDAIANEYGDVFWEEGRLPLGMRFAGSTVRITIERVKGE